MKAKRMLALAVAAVMSVSVLTVTALAANTKDAVQETTESTVQTERRKPHGKKEKVEAPENAIGKDAAKEAALKDAGLTAEQTGKVRSHVSKTEDGTIVYKVHFSANDTWYSYKIDACTGKVIAHTEQTAEEHAAAKENARAKKSTAEGTDESASSSGGKHGKRMRPDAADAAEGTAAASEQPARAHGKNSKSAADAADQTTVSLDAQTSKSI